MPVSEGLPHIPGLDRLIELYRGGVSTHVMAVDPTLGATLLADVDGESSRRWKVYHTLQALITLGYVDRRDRFQRRESKPRVVATTEYGSVEPEPESAESSHWEANLKEYEKFIGAPQKRRTATRSTQGNHYEAVVISDTHVPEERMDFIAQISERHRGLDLYIAGDINDFEGCGKYLKTNWDLPSLQSVLARTDAMFEFLARYHPRIYVLFGNHDLRLPRAASRALGPDYYWMGQEFLVWAYEKRHGVQVIRNQVSKPSGRDIDLFFYHQLGDCIISHAECSGAKQGSGAERAHNYFRGINRYLDRPDFRVILQAHTHKTSYFEHPQTGVHCFEIGTVGDISDYVLHEPKYGPPQHGYFHLVQEGGVTDINSSRLYRL